MFGWAVTFEKTVVSCGPWKNSCEKSRRSFGWAAIFFYQKIVKGTHISSTIIPMGPSRGRGAAWGGRGASTTMRAGTRTRRTRLVVRWREGRWGAPRKRSREGGESDVKKNTNRYLHNQWQVNNLYAQKLVKVGESAFGSVLVKSWLWKKNVATGRSKTNFRRL